MRACVRPGARVARRLVDAIRATGYGAALPAADSVAAEQEAQDKARAAEFPSCANKAVVAFAIGVAGDGRADVGADGAHERDQRGAPAVVVGDARRDAPP